MGAREWAQEVEDAAWFIVREEEARRVRRERLSTLPTMKYERIVRGHVRDAMGRVDEAVDADAETDAALVRAYDLVADAKAVYEGMRRAGSKLANAADLLEFKTLWLMSYREAASVMLMSSATARRYVAYAFDWLDLVGLERARAGVGIAED